MSRYRSHIVLTVWPLALLLVLELVRTWPALRGASSFAASSPASWTSLLVSTVAIVLVLVVYARGWSVLRAESPNGEGPYRTEGCRRLQKLAGGVAWGLVVTHLILHWVMTFRVGPVALSQYELLCGFLSRPWVVAFYMFGLAAFGLFLSQGLAASLRAWGVARSPESSRWLEVGCTLAAALTMLIAINVLSHFVTGRAYWMGP